MNNVTYEPSMKNNAMSTNVPPKQQSDTELTAQALPADDANDASINENMMTEDELALDESGEVIDDELLDDGLLDDDDDAEDYEEGYEKDHEAPSAGQAVEQVIDVSHTVTETESGQRIDKLASMVFTDFSRAQLQTWIGDGSLLNNGSTQKPKNLSLIHI